MRDSPMRLIQLRVTDRERHQIQDAASEDDRAETGREEHDLSTIMKARLP